MTHASVPADQRQVLGIGDNFIRLSVGIEDTEDIIEDIDQALKSAVGILSEKDQENIFSFLNQLFKFCSNNLSISFPGFALTT